ncbi:MAG: DEAD/DEAH box helicase [Polyangiaceae bacterium]|nr:DEAD/DEAH box helicase [Polyangiaceae bacterium]
MKTALPIDALRAELLAALQQTSIAISAPTGTGKSTRIPQWLDGKVLIVQPRRVAARAVASRIAEELGSPLGQEVGYHVKNDRLATAQTRLLVVTPGIALHAPELLESADILVLDELHERRLDTDLLLALAKKRKLKTIALSATMDAEAVAAYLGGRAFQLEARTYPVTICSIDDGSTLPHGRQLSKRVAQALASSPPLDGDTLVFLPGKREIEECRRQLHSDYLVVCLHGGLSLREQARALQPSKQARIILATNVAETSLTLPGVTQVIDSGLVRRTHYHEGRSYLALTAISQASAIQRSGRAGRVGPGKCLRLWSPSAKLDEQTPAEIHREALGELILLSGLFRERPEDLNFLEDPLPYALADARQELQALGALNDKGELTALGIELVRLPIDPLLGKLVVASKGQSCRPDLLRLVALLATPGAVQEAQALDPDELEYTYCDAARLLTALEKLPAGPGTALHEARLLAHLLSAEEALPAARKLEGQEPDLPLSPGRRKDLLQFILATTPQLGLVTRQRRQRTFLTRGKTEFTLHRDSLACQQENLEALVQLSTFARLDDRGRREQIVSQASAIPRKWLAEAGIGKEEPGEVSWKGGKLHCTLRLTLGGETLRERAVIPKGTYFRQALTLLFTQGRWRKELLHEARRRIERRALAARLGKSGRNEYFKEIQPPEELMQWFSAHLDELGVEDAEDLELLNAEDLLPEPLPAHLAPLLDDGFPQEVDLGDSVYKVTYDLEKNQALLSLARGNRKKPPPAQFLPKIVGFRLYVEAGGCFHAIKR